MTFARALTLALALLAVAAPAYAQDPILALYANQASYGGAPPPYPPTFLLNTRAVDAPASVVVVDPAIGEIGAGPWTQTGKPVPGLLYGPFLIPVWTPPPWSFYFTRPEPAHWRVVGTLAGPPLAGGRELHVSIDGEEPIVLRCASATTPWGTTSVFCQR